MFKFELDRQMIMVISECLANGPYKVVGPVIAELQRQINEQAGAEKPKADREAA